MKEFGVEEIEYLGLKISKNRIQVADDKVEALRAYKSQTLTKHYTVFWHGVQQLLVCVHT